MTSPFLLPTVLVPRDSLLSYSKYCWGSRTWVRTALLGLLALLLSGCPAPPVVTVDDTYNKLKASIEVLVQAGKYAEAAQAWLDAAAKLKPPERQRYEYEAAQVQVQAGDGEAAASILRAMDLASASEGIAQSARLFLAERAFARGDFARVLEWLPLSMKTSGSQQRRVYTLRANAMARLGDTLGAARQWIALQGLAGAGEDVANQDGLWELLFRSPLSTLEMALDQLGGRQTADAQLRGWIELALVFKRYGLAPAQLQSASIDWQRAYPAHPANQGLLQRQLARFTAPLPRPKRIHVLLPLSGKYARVGKAVQDGLVLAFYGSDTHPQLQFTDTAGGDAAVLYREAVAAGANAVIGPVLKPAVDALARYGVDSGGLSIPVLTLNKTSIKGALPDNLFQFGLAPEDDALNAAQYALSRGWRRALLLVPDSDWGKRIRDSFVAEYKAGGGLVLNDQLLPAKTADLATPMKRVLGLDASEQRRQALSRVLGIRLEFEPRRRADAQMVFLAARARQARVVRPLLKFLHASDLPVIATSHAYQGSADAVRDRDLEKLIFTDIPWVVGDGRYAALRSRAEQLWPSAAGRLPRLFALGYDAYTVLPYVQRLRATSPQSLPGATGRLFADEQGVIHRKTLWASFQRGVPRLLEPVSLASGAWGNTVDDAVDQTPRVVAR